MNIKNKEWSVALVVILVIIIALVIYISISSSRQKSLGGEKTRNELGVSESGELIPTIYSISPLLGPMGTVIEIKGKNVEPSTVIFKSKTSNNITDLRSSYFDRTVLNNDSVKIIVKDPCVKGEVVFYRFMTNTHGCDQYSKLVPGIYDVYLTTEEWESNKVEFTITAN